MSGCEPIRLELGAYVLGGLEESEVEALEEHLARCGRCRAELDELAPLPQLLAVADDAAPKAPADLRRRVLGRARTRRRRVPLALAAAVAVVAALAGATVTTWVQRPPAPDAALDLRGTETAGLVGAAQLAQVPEGVELVLELAGARPADEGYYHAWLEGGDVRASAGTFVGPDDGVVRARLLCGGRLEDYERLTVTWHEFGSDAEVVAAEADLRG